jgi:hypothetical protein
VQYLVLLRTVDADVGCGTEVGDLGIERSEFRNLDEVAETLFLHHLVGDGECRRRVRKKLLKPLV